MFKVMQNSVCYKRDTLPEMVVALAGLFSESGWPIGIRVEDVTDFNHFTLHGVKYTLEGFGLDDVCRFFGFEYVSNHKSYDEGYERGLKVGLHKGYNKGWSEGYNKGLYEDSHKSVKPSHDEALLKALKEWHESS